MLLKTVVSVPVSLAFPSFLLLLISNDTPNFILARKRPLMFTLSSLLRVALWLSRWSILKTFLHALEKTVLLPLGACSQDPGWVVHPAASLRPSHPRRPSARFSLIACSGGDHVPLLRWKGPLLFPLPSVLPREPRLFRSV